MLSEFSGFSKIKLRCDEAGAGIVELFAMLLASEDIVVDQDGASITFSFRKTDYESVTFARIFGRIENTTSGEGSLHLQTRDGLGILQDVFTSLLGDANPVRLNSKSYEWVEDFDDEANGVQFEAGLVADFWTTAGTNYNANLVTYAAGAGGTVQAVTAGANDDSVTSLAVPLWRIDANPILEARFKVADISNVWICAGFAEGSFADKATPDDDICVVGIDSDNGHGFGADEIVVVTNDNGATAVYGDCRVTITADTFITIRIDLTDTEQPRIWVNNTGEQITPDDEVAAASITGTVQAGISVAPYFMVQSLTGAADTFTIEYIKTWQSRV